MTGFVSMNLFAGLRNPSWRLSDTDAARFKRLLTNLEVVPAAGPQGERGFARRRAPAYAIAGDVANVLDGADLSGLVRAAPLEEDDQSDVLSRPLSGFRGFNVVFDAEGAAPQWFETYDRLVVDTASGSLRRDHGSPTVEQMLYESAPDIVVRQLNGMTFADLIRAGNEVPIDRLEGPDHHLQCESSPEYQGNTGAWKTHKLDNNCYNYANDKLFTTPFGPAVPGRGNDLGSSSNPLTEGSLKSELGADKLERVGMKLPSACPPDGAHVLAVVLRHHPVTDAVKDFHCIRLDRGGAWSHKDGIGRVRKIDDAHQPITDLTTARFWWSPTLVGIYVAFFKRRDLID